MTITYHRDLVQGSDEWHAARCGMLTASEMRLIITPTLKVASNDKQRAHVLEIAAQRVTRYVEPSFISDDMLRGQTDEIEARALYADRYAPVTECGFITNDHWGFTLGCSPDGLVERDGMIEVKSRRQRFQVQTIAARAMPGDYLMQVQTALLVTGRDWCDFISYSGGLPMVTLRVYPDAKVQEAILEAAESFEVAVSALVDSYEAAAKSNMRLIPTERRVEMEMTI